MRRADRLFELIHLLRRARKAITAAQLAETLEVAPRTVYRDVAALMAMGVPIDGAAGVGYIMRPGHDLPPLMFDREEVEAVAVGLQLVNRTGDQDLQAGRPPGCRQGRERPARAPRRRARRRPVRGLGLRSADGGRHGNAAIRGPRQPPPRPRLPRRARTGDRAHLPAACRHLLHRGHGARRLVRASRRFPPLSRRPHRRLPRDGRPLRRPRAAVATRLAVPGGACPVRAGTEVSVRAIPDASPHGREKAASSRATAASVHDAVAPAVPAPGQQPSSASGRVW